MTLREYLSLLESQGQLLRIQAEVDPHLEAGAIAMRAFRQGGPALLFERVKGSAFPLAMNLNGTAERLRLGLGIEPAELGARLARLAEGLQPPTLKALYEHRATLARGLAARTRRVGSSAVQAVVQEPPDLGRLPALQCWPHDAGRFLTLPLVQTADPATGRTNLGMYRMQVYGPSETGMHWQIVRGAEAHAAKAGQGAQLPCCVALGGDPALILSAIFPLPEGMEELAFAGLLRGRPQELVKAKTQPLWVPANAEFILEGVVDLADRRTEGPFGDHFGHYSHAGPYPTFRLTALTHRKNAVYPATIVGKPPQEDRVWGEAVNELSAPLLRLMHPELRGLWTYSEAGFHNLLVIAVDQRHPKEAVKTALGLLGQGQLSLCKAALLVDGHVDPRDFKAVLREALRHFDPREDALVIPGTPLDTLDFTSFTMNLGSKLILDCSSLRGPLPAARSAQPAAKEKKAARPKPFDPDKLEAVLGAAHLGHRSLEGALLVVQVAVAGEGAEEALAEVLRKVPLGDHKWVALVSEDVDLEDDTSLLWGLFTRFDAARDVQFTKSTLRHAWPLHEGVLGIDATWKQGYPEPLEMTDEVLKRVDKRWKEYGFR